MTNKKCDLVHPNGVKEKKIEVIDGYTIKIGRASCREKV